MLFSPHHAWGLRYWGFLILQHIQYENQGYPHLWYNLPLRSVPELCKNKFLNLPILVNTYTSYTPWVREREITIVCIKGYMQGLQIICWVELEGKFLVDLNYYITTVTSILLNNREIRQAEEAKCHCHDCLHLWPAQDIRGMWFTPGMYISVWEIRHWNLFMAKQIGTSIFKVPSNPSYSMIMILWNSYPNIDYNLDQYCQHYISNHWKVAIFKIVVWTVFIVWKLV